jgi:hypothetical protein
MARREGRGGRTPTLLDTGALDGDRYFDVFVEYAKADVEVRMAPALTTSPSTTRTLSSVLARTSTMRSGTR